MLQKFLKFLFNLTFIGSVATVLIFVAARIAAEQIAQPQIFTKENAPASPVAIVFGAGLNRDGSPSRILHDRVQTAVDLYFSGKVQKLLMSGDNSTLDYNEPGAMLDFALELGVPREDIVLDYAGRRTYDTCYRAKEIFGVNQAILVTQEYHLPRSLVTCSALGIQVSGVPADIGFYRPSSMYRFVLREIPATLVSFLDIYLTKPVPILGEKEPILFSATTQP